jgi:hypothetical protein
LIAAGCVEVGQLEAIWIAARERSQAIGALAGVARLPPPVALKDGAVGVGGHQKVAVDDERMCGRCAVTVSRKVVVAKDALARVSRVLSFPQARIGDV